MQKRKEFYNDKIIWNKFEKYFRKKYKLKDITPIKNCPWHYTEFEIFKAGYNAENN